MLKNIVNPLTIALVLFLSIGTVSCQNNKSVQKNNAGNTVAAGGGSIPVDEFEKRVTENPEAQVIDVRTAEEYAGGHLKNAINININSSDFEQAIAALNKNKPAFVYCLAGSRSAQAAQYMRNAGFTTVYEMSGGIIKWNAAGKALETGDGAPKKQGLSMNEFTKMVTTNSYVLVDFNAAWCKPCMQMAPMLDKVASDKKDKLILLKVDADANPELLKQKNIENIPVLELYLKGKLVWSHEGLIDEATLLKEIKL